MFWLLLFDSSMRLKSLIQHPVIPCWMYGRLWYQLFWNQCFSFCVLYFGLLRQSVVLLWSQISMRCLHNPIYKTKQCWRSVDSHFEDVVTKLSCTVLVEKDAITWYMDHFHKAMFELPEIHYQKSLMLLWRLFSEWGREHAAIAVGTIGGWYLIYGCLLPIAT